MREQVHQPAGHYGKDSKGTEKHQEIFEAISGPIPGDEGKNQRRQNTENQQ
jgi:hypothetical protein